MKQDTKVYYRNVNLRARHAKKTIARIVATFLLK